MAELNAGRVARFTLLLALLLFVVLLAHALLSVPGGEVLPTLRLNYCLALAAGRLIDQLLAVQLGAVLLAASLPAAGRRRATRPRAARMGPGLLGLLALTVLYGIAALGLAGTVGRASRELRLTSEVVRELRHRLSGETERQNWAEALDLADRLLRVTPHDRALGQERTRLSIEHDKAKARRTAAAAPAAAGPAAGLEIEALLDRSRAALSAGDAFTAFHYAALAGELDGKSFEAGQLLRESRAMIAERVPREDPVAEERYRRKLEGHRALERGESLRAWRILRDLAEELPHDREIGELARESLKRVQAEAFFAEDADLALVQPGTREVVFLNPAGQPSRPGVREVVFLGRVVESHAGTFAEGFEALRFSPEGRLLRHVRAPVARLDGKAVLLRGVSRADGAVRSGPRYLAGAPEEKNLDVLPLAVAEELLPVLRADGGGWDAAGLRTLLRLRTGLQELGWGRQELELEILRRGSAPLSFLVLSLLAFSLGWSFRGSGQGRLPLHYLLLAPAVAGASFLAAGLYTSVLRVLCAFLLLRLGFLPALLAVAGFLAALLAAALVILAGQRPDEA